MEPRRSANHREAKYKESTPRTVVMPWLRSPPKPSSQNNNFKKENQLRRQQRKLHGILMLSQLTKKRAGRSHKGAKWKVNTGWYT